ncbi:MAG: nitroreductase family protein [Lentisphaeria bacterium]|nr:nitroreductase family protein [Lentisphaeria bacterium]
MKKFLLSFFALYVMLLSGTDIQLPVPQKSGGMGLNEVLNTRRSVRRFTEKAVTLQELSDILWSANGITRANGKRTAPSALNKQEIMLYVTMKEGSFLFDPVLGRLQEVSPEDLRKYAGKYNAPCYIILVADTKKQNREIFAAIDTGYVSQNIYLAATARNLGTCAMGSIADRKILQEKLALQNNKIMLVHPLGTPAK